MLRSEKVSGSVSISEVALDALEENIAILDEESTVVATNKAWNEFARAHGHTHPETMLGMDYLEVCESTFGSHADKAREAYEGILAVRSGRQEAFVMDYPCFSAHDQHWFTMRVSSFIHDNKKYIVVAHEDITSIKKTESELEAYKEELERILGETAGELSSTTSSLKKEMQERKRYETALRESEEQLKAFLENIPVAAYIKDKQGQYLRVNRYFADMARTSVEDVIGKTDYQIFPHKYAEEFVKHDEEVCSRRESLTVEEHIAIEGEEYINLSVKFPLFNVYGEPYAVGGISLDMTERQLLINRLREAKENAEAASKAKSLFLGNVTHELRTPLNSIINLSDILLDTELDPEQQDYLRDISTASQKLYTMVEDFLELNRLEADGLTEEVQPFSLIDAVGMVVSALQKNNTNPDIEVESNIGALPVVSVSGRPFALQQILERLGENALKFSNQGTVEFSVEEVQRDEETVWYRFAISDTGIGIAEDTQQELFDDFTQADGSSTRVYGGLGLGLTMVRRLVSLQGGSVWVESRKGEGSTFFVSLPFERMQ
jgi:PAS domain S-box-containing protein